jgi:hypothetical protein
MLRLHVDDSQMEWVCEQHQKGKYLYTNAWKLPHVRFAKFLELVLVWTR